MSHWKVFGWSDPELDQPAPVRSSLLFEDYAVANITKLKYHSAFYLTIIIKRKSHKHLLWLFLFELIDFWWQQMNGHNAVLKKQPIIFLQVAILQAVLQWWRMPPTC